MTALKNEWFIFLKMAFRVRKVFGVFEKGAPGRKWPLRASTPLGGVLYKSTRDARKFGNDLERYKGIVKV